MRLFFTGASTALATQTESVKSLGGLISTSPVPNDQKNALFSTLSEFTVTKGNKEVRCVVLKNESGGDLTNVNIWYDNLSQDAITNYRMALVTPATNSDGDLAFESVDNIFTTPIVADFYDNRGSANALIIPSLLADAYIGVWVERSINSYAVNTARTCDALYAKFSTTDAAEVTEMTFVADVGGSLNSTYFQFDTLKDRYYVWFNINSAGVDPAIAGRTGIEVAGATGATADTLATAFVTALSLAVQRGELTASNASGVVTTTLTEVGEVTDPSDAGSSGVTFSVTTQGSTIAAEETEDFQISYSY
jgi:hypothetical protein